MLLLIVSYLLLVFVIPIALSLIVSFRALPKGVGCAQCGAETLRIRARLLNVISPVRAGVALQRRWCMRCGWEGVIRLGRERKADTKPRVPQTSSMETKTVADSITATQTLDVRSVTVDGRPFRVMLQCWHRTGLFYGRLVFIGPSGRLWLDAVESFSGSNQHEVLGLAQSLPDGLLENRLRRLVSDH